MFHLASWFGLIDPGAQYVNIAAVDDPVLFNAGNDLRVPPDLPFLIGEAASIDPTNRVGARISSPSLRRVNNVMIAPFSVTPAFVSGDEYTMHPDAPRQLEVAESLSCEVNSDPAAPANHWGFAFLGDGPQQPVSGDMYSVACTADVVGPTLGTWTPGTIQFVEDLPVGNYDIVGMRLWHATGVAARLILTGQTPRPGVICPLNADDPDNFHHRAGRLGVWGSFHTNFPPAIDFMGSAALVAYPGLTLDLIPRG